MKDLQPISITRILPQMLHYGASRIHSADEQDMPSILLDKLLHSFKMIQHARTLYY